MKDRELAYIIAMFGFLTLLLITMLIYLLWKNANILRQKNILNNQSRTSLNLAPVCYLETL